MTPITGFNPGQNQQPLVVGEWLVVKTERWRFELFPGSARDFLF